MNKRLELERNNELGEGVVSAKHHGSFQEGEEAFKASMTDSFTAQ